MSALPAHHRLPAPLLRGALLGNAVFSSLSGLTMLLGSEALFHSLGLHDRGFLLSTGAMLLGFAGLLIWLATRDRPSIPLIWFVIVSDWLWVAGSAAMVAMHWTALPAAGLWTIGIVADVVMVFAILQMWGLRRMQDTVKSSPA